MYNLERPHEACGLAPPISRYRPSARSYPETLPAVEYPTGMVVRRVQADGDVSLHGRTYRVPDAFRGQPVGLQPTAEDGAWAVYFSRFKVAEIDLRRPRR